MFFVKQIVSGEDRFNFSPASLPARRVNAWRNEPECRHETAPTPVGESWNYDPGTLTCDPVLMTFGGLFEAGRTGPAAAGESCAVLASQSAKRV